MGRVWKWGSNITSVTDSTPPGLQRIIDFLQRRLPIGELAQHRHQQGAIEPIAAELALPRCRLKKANVGELRGACFFPCPVEHTCRDIHGHDLALRADHLAERDREPARAAAEVQYGHAGVDIQTLHDDRGAICLGEGIVQLDEPAQPRRARDRTAAGHQAPYAGGENNEDHQTEEDIRRCRHLFPVCDALRPTLTRRRRNRNAVRTGRRSRRSRTARCRDWRARASCRRECTPRRSRG